MKCPKCQFVSFEGEVCKKCGYNFVTKKGGARFSLFKKLFGKNKDEPPIKKEEAPIEEKEELTELTPEELISDEASQEEIAHEALPESIPDEKMIPAEKMPQEAAVAESEDEFDDQFDNLFGDDKEAVKGGNDAIMITATDSHSEGGGAEDMEDMHDYGFDPYAEVIVPSDTPEPSFDDSIDDSINSIITDTSDAAGSSGDNIIGEDEGDYDEDPFAQSTATDDSLKIVVPEGSTGEEDDVAADFMKEFTSTAQKSGDEE